MKGRRSVLTALAGFALAVFVWLAAAWDDLLGLENISNCYLPGAALFIVFLFGLCINPLLRRLRPDMALGRDQMVMVSAMVVMAGIVPAFVLMRYLPSLVVSACANAADSQLTADLYDKLQLRSWLFPAGLKYGARSPVVDHCLDELPAG